MAEAGGRLRRRVFLSTEDPDAVAYFGALAPRWAAAWTDGPRKPDRTKSTLAYVAEVVACTDGAGCASRSCTAEESHGLVVARRRCAGSLSDGRPSPRPSWTAHTTCLCT